MDIENNASIAQAVITLAQGGAPLVAGVLTHAIGDDAEGIAARAGQAIGMHVERIETDRIEYHPGALNLVAVRQVEPATATGLPVLFILADAGTASRCVVSAMCSIIEKRLEGAPCAILALSCDLAEARVAAEIAEGLDGHVQQVASMRTSRENARLVEDAVARMGG
jgi:hypothetical protein